MEIKKIAVGAFQANCYILTDGNETIVIDPGDETGRILRALGSRKVKYIVLTHYHWDHTSAASELKGLTGAEILAHEDEKDFLQIQADRYLREGEELKIGKVLLKVVLTPGHSRGSICLLGENFIFTGDTVFANGGVGRTDIAGGSYEELAKSLKKIKKIFLPNMTVYPGHGETFTIDI